MYKRKNIDFYHTQNFVNSLIKFLNFDFKLMTLKRSNINYFHPGKSAEIFLGKKLIARYGEIHPNISKQFTKHKNIYCVELYFENLPIEATFRKQKKSLFSSEFQFSDKDFSFVVDDSQNLQEIYQYLRSIDKKLIQQIEFYDSFVSENLGLNKKSFTFRVRIQSSDKTLSEEDLNTLHNKIIDNLKEKFNAVLRS